MVLTARKTAFRFQLAIAACLMSGVAGCQVDRPRLTWRSALAQEAKDSCSDACCEAGAACGTYQPTVWEPWHAGPMAMLCGQGESALESDPKWLKDVTRPKSRTGDMRQPEAIPLPPASGNENSASELGGGFKLQREDLAAPAAIEKESSKSDLGAGFKLQPPAAPPQETDEGSKPALKGIESAAEKPLPLKPDHDGAASPTPVPNKVPGALPPKGTSNDKNPSPQPNFLPPSPPVIN
jgi:hypothetical protein